MKKPMRRRTQRLIAIAAAGGLLALALALTLTALKNQVTYFYKPSELAAKAQPGQRVRIGGLVERGSVVRAGQSVTFAVVDASGGRVLVAFNEPTPKLFDEGQGVVAEGVWSASAQRFHADRVLAKHDENYMPPEVAAALKQEHVWRGPEGGK